MCKLIPMIVLAGLCGVVGCSQEKRSPATRPAGHRIITFSPGLTSIVFDMGLGDQVVGVTRFCILPPGVQRPALGDRQNLTGEALLQLNPDMIFVQQDPQQFEELRKFKPDLRIEHFSMERLIDVRNAMRRIGELTDRGDLAEQAVQRFCGTLARVSQAVHGLTPPSVLFMTGYERPLVAGPDTFVGDMIDAAGGKNCGGAIEGYIGWRDASLEGILKAAPEVLVCQVEPGQEEAAQQFWQKLHELPAVRRKAVFIVTDRRWSIPGPHSAQFAQQLAGMIHPEAMAALKAASQNADGAEACPTMPSTASAPCLQPATP